MIIDTHHHFWHYNTDDFGWINEEMKTIRRDFLPAHLHNEITQAGVDGVISVQARQIEDETRWLLKMARNNEFIKGVVGWLPLVNKNVDHLIAKYAYDKNLKGLRHVVQDEPDDQFILRDDFNKGVSLLKRYNLVYDILIFEKHLPYTIQFVDKHPNQAFVLDHIAKPKIKDNIFSPWKENIIELAKRENVYCKISGMVTEADFKDWSEDQLKPYVDVVIEAFGSKRLMLGSDWPVCLVATEYNKWIDLVKKFIVKLSSDEQERILGKNAVEVYRL
ncbi:MAG: amidohydrolase family protein [Bacteroidales bacterium]|nr:amidohydrolase family protein [Bacteroidales bacterium]